MKAIIFLAGIGSRLKAITDDPKCLIEIGRKPIIHHQLGILNDLGIHEVILVVGYKQEKIRKTLGNSYKNIKLKYIENKNYLKGSILSLLYAKDEFNDDIITMDGDVIFDKKILQNLIKSKNKNCFSVDFNFPNLGDEMKVVTNRQGVVKEVNYKIKKQKGCVVGEEVGFIKWSKKDSPTFRKVFEGLLKQGIDDDVYEKAVRYLIDNKLSKFGVASTENIPWIEIDFPEDLEKAKRFLSEDEIKPVKTEKIKTKYRKIVSDQIPGSKSLELIQRLKIYEPITSINQLPVGIAKTYGINIKDIDGNIFLDGTSGVVVTNIGHSPKVVTEKIKDQLKKFHHVYSFPYERRVELSKKLVEIAPENIDQALILTTGSEATEAAIKVVRKYNQTKNCPEKRVIIGFKGAFHGKTMGAQMAGGIDSLKTWIGYQDPGLIQVEFPNCYRCWKKRKQYENCTEDCLDLLRKKFKENPGKIAAVISETYQGRDLIFVPEDFFREVEKICKENDAIFILDEIQAGFGRLGKIFGFENYGVKPNLICCGKGISSGLPLSALLGESKLLNSAGKGDMTTTHSADPICVAATIANIEKLLEGDKAIMKNVIKNENIFKKELDRLKEKYNCIGDVRGKGMVWGLDIVKNRDTKEPDSELANKIHLNIYRKGVLLKVPRGGSHNVININPPLIMLEEAVKEILKVLDESVEEALK